MPFVSIHLESHWIGMFFQVWPTFNEFILLLLLFLRHCFSNAKQPNNKYFYFSLILIASFSKDHKFVMIASNAIMYNTRTNSGFRWKKNQHEHILIFKAHAIEPFKLNNLKVSRMVNATFRSLSLCVYGVCVILLCVWINILFFRLSLL